MITAATYAFVVVPTFVIALTVGAVLWTKHSTRIFDEARASRNALRQARESAVTPSQFYGGGMAQDMPRAPSGTVHIQGKPHG